MKYFHPLLIVLLFTSIFSFSQEKPERKKITISGLVIDKNSKQPLEYATITLLNTKNPKALFGGITNPKGEFLIEVNPGNYDIKIEFISYKLVEIKAKQVQENTNLGTIELSEDATQLQSVEVRAEKTTVELKLDKKVYNVGKDLMVKGGTVSDVLNNIPSVSVDAEGSISLRGNENVRILIDGRPSNAINITEALRLIPADAIEKVEVITNPSARYDAEGGAGILNIVLKKGKTNGLNGTFIATTGFPANHGLSTTLNYKTETFNLFTTQGYAYRDNPGNGFFNSRYLNLDGSSKSVVNENRDNQRASKGYNSNFGFDWFLTKNTTWTNTINYRKNNSDNVDTVTQENQTVAQVFDYTRTRENLEDSFSVNAEFTTGFVQKFKKESHKLTIDGAFSVNRDDNNSLISDRNTLNTIVSNDITKNKQVQAKNILQTDYVLPFGKGNQLEMGYRGEFTDLITDFGVQTNLIVNPNFTDEIQYKEKINAIYTQYGLKKNKISVLLGLRYEDSDIDINSLLKQKYSNKKYNNFFPSAFFTYEISDKSSASISYSKRIQRPRGRQIIPFNNFSSNANVFQGNPDLNPSMTDAIDFGFLKKWDNLSLSTSIYTNKTNDVFQFTRRESGSVINGVPVIIASPFNLSAEYRTGFEFTINYSPFKWWKLNSNFNFFDVRSKGDLVYTNFNNQVITQNFDNKTSSWFARLNSKVTLPHKIDFQTNATYNGPQNNKQGKTYGIFAANIALSKDLLKDKATIALSVNDLLNSRKRIFDTYIPGSVESYTEFQFRERQTTLSFTYRFNKKKTEEKPKRQEEGGGGDF